MPFAASPPPGTRPDLRLRLTLRPGWVNPELQPPNPWDPEAWRAPPPEPASAPTARPASAPDPRGGVGVEPGDLPDSGGLQPSPLGEVQAEGALGWARHDLRLVARGAEAEATLDGTAAACEAALQLALQVALLPAGVLWIHGAAGVDHAGRAWLVPGASGAGKSTLAREAGFVRVLADEMVAVRLGAAGGFEVHGTPFWSHGRRLPLDAGSAPLAVLALPVKAPAVWVRPLDEAEAVAHLLSQVALYETSAAARLRAFELACAVAAQTRCVALGFVREGPWLSTAETQLVNLPPKTSG